MSSSKINEYDLDPNIDMAKQTTLESVDAKVDEIKSKLDDQNLSSVSELGDESISTAWILDYKSSGSKSYVFNDKDILRRFMNTATAINDRDISVTSLNYNITNRATCELRDWLSRAYELRANASSGMYDSIGSIEDLVLDEIALNSILSAPFVKESFLNSNEALSVMKANDKSLAKYLAVLAGINHTSIPDLNTLITNSTYLAKVAKSTNAMTALADSDIAMDVVLASQAAMDTLIGTATTMTILAASNNAMTKIVNSSSARLTLYNKYSVTQSILANSSNALSVMKASSQTTTVSAVAMSVSSATAVAYSGKAFVFEIWNSGSYSKTAYHGVYLTGNSIETRSLSTAHDTVNRFASSVKNGTTTNNSDFATMYHQIFKI